MTCWPDDFPALSSQDDLAKEGTVQAPQERVQTVKPFWETVEPDERKKLLTVSVADLVARGEDVAAKQRKQLGERNVCCLSASLEQLLAGLLNEPGNVCKSESGKQKQLAECGSAIQS